MSYAATACWRESLEGRNRSVARSFNKGLGSLVPRGQPEFLEVYLAELRAWVSEYLEYDLDDYSQWRRAILDVVGPADIQTWQWHRQNIAISELVARIREADESDVKDDGPAAARLVLATMEEPLEYADT